MSNNPFVLEDAIPLPEAEPDPSEELDNLPAPEETTETPEDVIERRERKKRCKQGQCVGSPCLKCKDVFPCRHDCRHWDCKLEKGLALPDWVIYRESGGDTDAEDLDRPGPRDNTSDPLRDPEPNG